MLPERADICVRLFVQFGRGQRRLSTCQSEILNVHAHDCSFLRGAGQAAHCHCEHALRQVLIELLSSACYCFTRIELTDDEVEADLLQIQGVVQC